MPHKKKQGRIGQQKPLPAVGIHKPTEPYSSFTERASVDDRAWFEAHPEAKWRLRPYMVGEFRDMVPSCDDQTYVYQMEPGLRLRTNLSPSEAALIKSGKMTYEPQIEDGHVSWFGALESLIEEDPYDA